MSTIYNTPEERRKTLGIAMSRLSDAADKIDAGLNHITSIAGEKPEKHTTVQEIKKLQLQLWTLRTKLNSDFTMADLGNFSQEKI